MKPKVQDIVIKLIQEREGGKIDFNTSMKEVQLDSIAYIKLIVEIEEMFHIEFDTDKLAKSTYNKVGDLIEYVEYAIQYKKRDNKD